MFHQHFTTKTLERKAFANIAVTPAFREAASNSSVYIPMKHLLGPCPKPAASGKARKY
jgi:hypothetical protein